MKSGIRFPALVLFIALLCSSSINTSLAARHLLGPPIPQPPLFPPPLPLPGFGGFPFGFLPPGPFPFLPGFPIGPIGFPIPLAPGLGGAPFPAFLPGDVGFPRVGFTANQNEIPVPGGNGASADQATQNSVPIVPPN